MELVLSNDIDHALVEDSNYIRPLEQLGMTDVALVGGKNASLGEMLTHLHVAGVNVPTGFALTVNAFNDFLVQNGLSQRIEKRLAQLNVDDIEQLGQAGRDIRGWIISASLPHAIQVALKSACQDLDCDRIHVAVRSSATAEDSPQASFAGQQDTILNVLGYDAVAEAILQVFASLFTDRAIAYRAHQNFLLSEVGLSVGVQQMVGGSPTSRSGVMFTLDTETGFDGIIFITSAWGVGEAVVQGEVNPDEFYVDKRVLVAKRPAVIRRILGSKAVRFVRKQDNRGGLYKEEVPTDLRQQFSLTDTQVETLAEIARRVEEHYQHPMDIEWVYDAESDQFYILQARPETVNTRPSSHHQVSAVKKSFRLSQKGKVLCEGRSVGRKIGVGKARVLERPEDMEIFQAGEVLVADMTDPDWEPVMKHAAAIVTNRGGRTCHAAIIARELGVPAVVGCGNATTVINSSDEVTVSCADGDTGVVYEGLLQFEITEKSLLQDTRPPCKVMLNVGNPDRAFDFSFLPNDGVGLARLEFIINRMIGIHPQALLELANLPLDIRQQIQHRIDCFGSATEYFHQRLSEGIATLACAFYPKPVIVRLSDFKSNEYLHLLGGHLFEPREENPMLGFRGTSRYLAPSFRPCFEMECKALHRVRFDMGYDNLWIMVPFVRTLDEAANVIDLLAENGLKRGHQGLQIIMMCELPANVILAREFLEYFDGFSIGSNDLTQLTLGLDRDSSLVADAFDERNPAVMELLRQAILACREKNKYIGICGQGPSDHPELAQFLLEQGIESLSLNPDTVVELWASLSANKTDSSTMVR